MLSRTADGLFWLARYMERAENVARILTAGQRIASLSRSVGGESNEWESTLVAAGCGESYREKRGEVTPGGVVDFLVRDPSNPSSVLSCLETARRNARAVRTALTADMWESLNDTWLELRSFESFEGASGERVARLLEWVKHRSLLYHGAYANTMLRNDAFYFTQLGTFLERADNTARILDVKYHVLLPEGQGVGGSLDYYQWQAILRTVSAARSYHWVYLERLAPWMIADLLILRPEMPRSLCACYAQVARHLELLAEQYGGKRGECHRRAAAMHARLRGGTIKEIFQSGLHEFLTGFVDEMIDLGNEIRAMYLT